MLEYLSKKDSYWREVAFNICKCKQKADDLVNDMYLKMHNSKLDPLEIEDGYIARTIKNLYIDSIKQNEKTVSLELFHNVEITENKTLEDRQVVNDALSELHFFYRDLLLGVHETSIRKYAKFLGAHYMTVFKMKKKAMDDLKETDTIKKYKSA